MRVISMESEVMTLKKNVAALADKRAVDHDRLRRLEEAVRALLDGQEDGQAGRKGRPGR